MSFPYIEAILRKFHCSILNNEPADFSETMVIFLADYMGPYPRRRSPSNMTIGSVVLPMLRLFWLVNFIDDSSHWGREEAPLCYS